MLFRSDSVFVLAAADCLTARHVQILVRAERLPETTIPLQCGAAEASSALSQLLSSLSSREVEKPAVLLTLSALGHAECAAFERQVDSAFGQGTFTRWLGAMEQRNFALAVSTLKAH